MVEVQSYFANLDITNFEYFCFDISTLLFSILSNFQFKLFSKVMRKIINA